MLGEHLLLPTVDASAECTPVLALVLVTGSWVLLLLDEVLYLFVVEGQLHQP